MNLRQFVQGVSNVFFYDKKVKEPQQDKEKATSTKI